MQFQTEQGAEGSRDIEMAEQQLIQVGAPPFPGSAEEFSTGAGEELPEAEMAPSATGRVPGYNLYNLVKIVAKEPDAQAARSRLDAAVQASPARLNAMNSKGSTALHACAYLKRWDLAQALLDAGADPSLKNAAGHTFFLTAVKDPAAPWQELFARHPELLEKHRKFLERGPRGGDRVSTPRPKRERAERVASSAAPLPEAGPSEANQSDASPLAEAMDRGDWVGYLELAKMDGAAQIRRVGLPSQLNLVRHAPWIATTWALRHGLRLEGEAGAALCERATRESLWESAQEWALAGSEMSDGEQRTIMERALKARQSEAIRALARAGWRYDDDFVEQCEECGDYDLADDLIDLRETRAPRTPAPAARADQQGKGARSASGKPARAKGRKAGGASKARSGRGANGRKASASMIANLDRPMKEANDFEYQERRPQAKVPVIIVKKARAIVAPLPLASN